MARFEFVLGSQEFQLFSRPQGLNVTKALEKLMPMSTAQKFERLQNITNIDLMAYDLMKKEQYNTRIQEFVFFSRVVEPLLQKIKGQTAQMMKTKLFVNQSYLEMHKAITRYEDMNLQHYTDMNSGELVLTNPDNAEVFNSLNEVGSKL
jgi:hypothetical protein